jgi:hypothetical protein
MLKAARDFGLDQEAVNAVALRFDPREPDVAGVADAEVARIVVELWRRSPGELTVRQ